MSARGKWARPQHKTRRKKGPQKRATTKKGDHRAALLRKSMFVCGLLRAAAAEHAVTFIADKAELGDARTLNDVEHLCRDLIAR